MALNFSHRPIFPSSNPSSNSFVPTCQEKGEVFGKSYYIDSATNESYSYGRDRGGVNNAGSCESSCTDIVDLLPSDPFGMNLDSTLKAAITFWIEDMTASYPGDLRRENQANRASGFNYYKASGWFPLESGMSHAYANGLVNQGLPEFLDFSYSKGLVNQGLPELVDFSYSKGLVNEGLPELLDFSSQGVFGMSSYSNYQLFGSNWVEACPVDLYSQVQVNHEVGSQFGDQVLLSGRNDAVEHNNILPEDAGEHVEGNSGGTDSESGEHCQNHLYFEGSHSNAEYGHVELLHGNLICEGKHDRGESKDGEPPHEGIVYALKHLGIRDLLSVERVCKSLCFAVQKDPLLWRCIHINQPLSEKLTDDALFQLAQRAEGSLQCLDLVKCVNITDAGLKRIIESNPRITKLSVPGCTRLTIDGIINILKFYKTPDTPQLKYLRVGGIYGPTQTNYEELKLLVGVDRCEQQETHNPRFSHVGFSSPSCDYGSALDIEVCPICKDVRLIYDCPAERCQGNAPDPCRACKLCIPRCFHCGKCIIDEDYVENFCLDNICMNCERSIRQTGEEMEISSKKTVPLSAESADIKHAVDAVMDVWNE